MQFDREVIDAVYRSHFGAFVCRAFEALNPGQRLVENWHIEAVCYSIQQMGLGEEPKEIGAQSTATEPEIAYCVGLPTGLVARPQCWRTNHLCQLFAGAENGGGSVRLSRGPGS